MTPRPPGKAAQAMQRLRDENAALRDLLAAVQETASTGERTRGEGRQRWFPAWWAAQRIAQWLDDTDGMEASLLAARAALFRGNAAEIAAAGEPAPADASACPSVSPDGDACTVEEPGHAWHYGPGEGGGVRRMWDDADAAAASGQPVAEGEDEAVITAPADPGWRDPATGLMSGRTYDHLNRLSCGCTFAGPLTWPAGRKAHCDSHGDVETVPGPDDPEHRPLLAVAPETEDAR